MKTLIALTLPLYLSGCWFVFIPGSVVSGVADTLSGNVGNMCVANETKIGGKIKMPPNGDLGTVQKLEGSSGRCTNPSLPIRALVQAD